ncbi:MAG TPA: hypothetical protein VF228_22760 [Iamia sp.]
MGYGVVVVHRARLLPRLVLVGGIMLVSFGITGAVVWFTVLGAADDVRDAQDATRFTVPAPGATDPVSVPQGWPEALAPPEGATVISSVATNAGTPDEQLVLVYEVARDGPVAADALRAQLEAAGLTITSDAVGPEGSGSLTAAGAGREASVAVAPTAARPGVTTLSWVLRPGLR